MKRKKKSRKEKERSKRHSVFSAKATQKIDILADRIPEILTGNKDMMHQKYASIYGSDRAREMVMESTRKTGKMYLIASCLLIILIVSFILKSVIGPEAFMDLTRSSYEGESKTLSTKIEAEYNGETQKKNAEIIVQPKGLTEKEKKVRMNKTKKNLGTLILGKNSNLKNITSKLDLLTTDPETGVEIAWKSGDERLVNKDGVVNPLIAKENEQVVLDAQLRLEEVTDSVKINIAFGKPTSGKELSDAISASVDKLISTLNEDDMGKQLTLPEKTAEGVSLTWKKNEGSEIAIQIALVLLICFCIYYSRYSTLDKKIKETRESISRDFPDFINKLVLLLNAGLVVTAAFEKISYDYRHRINKEDKKYLYEEFSAMDENIKSANSGFLMELNDIAQRSGVRDVMRFNTIIVDNIDKGSALVDKLQSESQILWTGRIKMAEEKGRIAETKLTFPMVLQLLVLIIITIAPAAMEM